MTRFQFLGKAGNNFGNPLKLSKSQKNLNIPFPFKFNWLLVMFNKISKKIFSQKSVIFLTLMRIIKRTKN
jgi:hypothetical protein